MANLPQTATWETGVYQIEITDPVIGGVDGISNRQAKQLANRTLFLKEKQETSESNISNMNNRLTNAESSVTSQGNRITNAEFNISGMRSGTVGFTKQPKNNNSSAAAATSFVMENRGGYSGYYGTNSNVSINQTRSGEVIHSGGAVSIVLTVSDNSSFRNGDTLTFFKTESGVMRVNLINQIASKIGFLNNVYIYSGEIIELIKAGDFWLLSKGSECLENVGNIEFSHKLKPGFLELNGALLNREAYPRLWEYAQEVGTVTDAVWSNAVNKGMFSSGNGTTTFRLPDFRDTFTRSKSASRNVGSYQEDEFKQHRHAGVPEYVVNQNSQLGNQFGSRFNINIEGYTGVNGGSETRPKNIALIQMIKY